MCNIYRISVCVCVSTVCVSCCKSFARFPLSFVARDLQHIIPTTIVHSFFSFRPLRGRTARRLNKLNVIT